MRVERRENKFSITVEVFFTPEEVETLFRQVIMGEIGVLDTSDMAIAAEELPQNLMSVVQAHMRTYDDSQALTADEPVEVSLRWIISKRTSSYPPPTPSPGHPLWPTRRR
jgi:hypothetical protein